ncbi:MAG: hypothetical protein J7K21_00180 [Desulfurococcales archaeon]|nr:hypothetical protein [Desulfurococcales archaeon]
MTNYSIISFYKREGEKITIEYLVEHVNTMIDLLNKDSRAIRFGEELLKSISSNVINYYDLIVSSIIFHDIGKAFYKYSIDKAIKQGREGAGFSGHEILSAFIMDEAVKTLSEEYPKEYSSTPFIPGIYSILFHHHALAITKRLPKAISYVFNKPREYYLEIVNLLLRDFKNIHYNTYLLNDLLNILEDSVISTLSHLNNPLTRFTELKGYLFRKLASREIELKKLMHLTLSTLICLDYEAARRKRGSPPSTFGRMCIKWLKYYVY